SELPADPAPRLHATGEALAEAFRAHGDDFRASLVSAVEKKILNGNSYKPAWITELFDALHQWCHAGARGAPFQHAKLPQLTRETLQLRTGVKHTGKTPDSPLCDTVPPYLDALAAMAEWQDARRVELLHRLRDDRPRRRCHRWPAGRGPGRASARPVRRRPGRRVPGHRCPPVAHF